MGVLIEVLIALMLILSFIGTLDWDAAKKRRRQPETETDWESI